MEKKELSYAEAIAKVEKILERLGSQQLDVDSLAAEVKQATELIGQCRARLRKAEEDLAKVINE